MNDPERTSAFTDEDGEFDIDAIFGNNSSTGSPPLSKDGEQSSEDDAASEEATSAPESTTKPDTEHDLFSAFFDDTKSTGTAVEVSKSSNAVSLFDKPPVFAYGSAKDPIADSSMTFEELRITKADDFPELSDGKKVSWSVEYGKVSKPISDPKGTTIASIKEEIEKSKTFLDGLKKAKEKDRNPDCFVRPRVTAQSKGIAAYKGIFGSVEDAKASDKTICLIPAQDGKVYELRKTEMGSFIAPKSKVIEFEKVRAGFIPALPLIPRSLIEKIISFFRSFMANNIEYEALVHIYWDKEQEEYRVIVPKQRVSKSDIYADLRESILPPERYIHYADVHSHNSMAARFSVTDDRDETATRLYFVIGKLDRFYPGISARFSCGGTYQEIDPALVLESIEEEFPTEWLDNVERCDVSAKEPTRHFSKEFIDMLHGLPKVLIT